MGKSILLVEDEAAIREMVLHALSRVGFETRAVADAVHADREIDQSRPDLILLDLNLPGMDGREVLAEVKSDDDLGMIPVVVLTTSTAQQDLLYSYGLRANSYVNKPIDRKRFNVMIRSVLDYWINIAVLPSD